MYLIKSITFNFARRLKLISSIIVGTVKDILRLVLYPLSLPLKLLLKRPKRRRFKHYKPNKNRRYNYTKGVAYNKRQRRWTDVIFSEKLDDDGFAIVDDNPDDKSGLNHKHDNYQSQIDMLARKINELLLNDEAYNKQFNRLESRVTELFKTDISTDKQFDKLEAKVNKMLSENSKLTFKPLTKEEEISLEIAEGECKWDDEVRDYPSEPDFQAEQKAMAKQMAKVVERDEA